jgi:chemotaxis protein MotB
LARRRRIPEHANHERWLVSYADFITLLFAFFTTLYAISNVDTKKAGKLASSMRSALNAEAVAATSAKPTPARSGPPTVVELPLSGAAPHVGIMGMEEFQQNQARISEIATQLRGLTEIPQLKGRVQVRVEPKGVVVSLAEAGFFQSGSAELRPGGKAALDLVAERLPRRDLDVTVEGHTDNVPVRNTRYSSNWELSTARATFVVALLFEQHGFDPAHLAAAGHAEFHPLSSNDTAEGRAHNRRVDIVVRPTPPSNVAAASAPADATPHVP